MESTYKGKMTSLMQEYETPDEIFLPLHKEFNFQVDLAGSESNHKLKEYYSKKDDAFKHDWYGRCWLNPEFITVGKWVKKAYLDSQKHHSTIVMLILSKTNTNWWRDYVMKAKEIRFINQKVRFKNTKQGLRFPACIVVFEDHQGDTKFSCFTQTQDGVV